ncbi:MAG: DUF4271 domain-containing protein [Prevotella sp.]|nr:DUF4271 domain-containing protein [Prevotella sp.]
MRQDSLTVSTGLAAGDSSQAAAASRPHEITPKEVLSWLPKDATPAQQDSAIQKHVKISEIHWSQQPDTLHMPGHSKGKSFRDVSLPQYYKESFFSKDSLFHPELSGGRLGVAGDPVPYTIAGDNLVTGLLLGCFILAMIALAKSREFILRQAKSFFHVQRGTTTEITETSGEIWVQLGLVIQTCLLFAITYFLYVRTYVTDTFTIEQYQIIGLFTAVIAGYCLVKALLYWMVDSVFFDSRAHDQWMKSYLFILSLEGVLMFPLVMLLAYFDLAIPSAVIYVAIVIIFVKMLTFYRLFIIFFREKSFFLQNILYLCALEVVPLAALWGVLVLMSNILKVNF